MQRSRNRTKTCVQQSLVPRAVYLQDYVCSGITVDNWTGAASKRTTVSVHTTDGRRSVAVTE